MVNEFRESISSDCHLDREQQETISGYYLAVAPGELALDTPTHLLSLRARNVSMWISRRRRRHERCLQIQHPLLNEFFVSWGSNEELLSIFTFSWL